MKKKHLWKWLIGGVLLTIGILAGMFFLLERQTYNTIYPLEFYESTSVENVSYKECLGGVLKYSRNGISLLNKKGEELWNQSCQMSNPVVDVRTETVAVFDRGGTSILILNEEGCRGEIQTTRPIEKVNVSEQGIVAAMLKDEEHPILICYDVEGNELIKQSTSLGNTGYPMDIAISEDGKMLLVSYLITKGTNIATKIVYYDFGGEDIDKKDYKVQEKEYEGSVIPITAFLNENTSVLVADNALIWYEGKDVPEEKAKIESGAIQSVSYDENILAVVVLDQETSNYKMQIYNMKGEQLSEVPLSKDYAQIKVSKNQILLYEGDMFAIYTKDGICKFDGKADMDILEMSVLVGLNKYLMINANGFYEIRLAN